MDVQTPSSFENEHVTVAVAKDKDCKVAFSITTKPLASKAARHAALKVVSKEVSLPGFRKGKAPISLIEQKFPSQIRGEMQDILARNALNEAINLTKIQPYSRNTKIQVTQIRELGADQFEVGVEFEAFPEVPKVNVEELSLKNVEPEALSQEAIDKKIYELQLYHADWQDITDRGAEPEDYVVLDIDLIDVEPHENIYSNSRFHMKEGKMPAWAMKLIQGLKVNESVEGTSEEENVKPRQCKLTIKYLQKPTLPELTDELAKKAGVQTVDELKSAIEKRLTKEAEVESKEAMRNEMRDLLCSKYSFDLPGERVKTLMMDCENAFDQRGSRNASSEERMTTIRSIFEDAKKTLQLSYLFPKVLRDFDLAFPNQKEVQERVIQKMMQRYMSGLDQPGEQEAEHYAMIAETELIGEKALDYLIEHAKKT
ncbi:MAG: trigger factor [Parachlamydiaceae bacterium]